MLAGWGEVGNSSRASVGRVPPLVSFVAVYCGKLSSAYILVRSLHSAVDSIDCRVVIISGTSHRSRTSLVRRQCPFMQALHDRGGLKFSKKGGLKVRVTRKGCLFLVGGSACLARSKLPTLVRQLRDSPHVKTMSPGVHFTFPPRGVRFTKCAGLDQCAVHGGTLNVKYPSSKAFSAPHPDTCLRKTTLVLGQRIV